MTSSPSAKDAEILTLTISDLSRGGAGVAKEANGRVVFVPYTAPGDEVRVRIVEEDRRYAQAELVEIVKPSPDRVTPPCPVFGRCGGCQWQHLPYEAQWRTKVRGVRHALARVQVAPPAEFGEFPAPRAYGYRNRVQLRGFKGELGYFAARSHTLVPADACPIARPEINADWDETRREGEGFEKPYKVELEALAGGAVRRVWNAAHGAEGFRQVYDEQNERLREWVAKVLTPGSRLLDLYGGAGNLSLGLASRMAAIECVDVNVPADASGTPPNFSFHRSPVLPWLIRRASGPKADAAIVDPPRAGLGGDLTEIALTLGRLGCREVVAVGCDPDSWARDLARWAKHGFVLSRAAVFDFFPQTPHVEAAGSLRVH